MSSGEAEPLREACGRGPSSGETCGADANVPICNGRRGASAGGRPAAAQPPRTDMCGAALPRIASMFLESAEEAEVSSAPSFGRRRKAAATSLAVRSELESTNKAQMSRSFGRSCGGGWSGAGRAWVSK